MKQILKSASEGKNSSISLGKPLKDKIIKEYKNDESPEIRNQEYFEDINLLIIDMSLKTIQSTIDQMGKFKSIKILVITGGAFGSPVNLNDLLTRARNYPLEELYIFNFKNYVKAVPKKVGHFKNLITLSLINNQIHNLPLEVGTLTRLKKLYVDVNPISSLLPTVSNLKQLEKLGIGKTKITELEIKKIEQLLPNCKILFQ